MTAGTISIIQGEDFTLNLAFTNADGSAYNLTGCSVSLVVRRNAISTPVISKPITSHTSPTGGLTAIPLSGVDTNLAIRAWQYQIILVDSSGADRPSGTYTFFVTAAGSTTNAVGVSIGSNSVTVTLNLAGAAGPGVSAGGTAGQVLTKNTNTNYDTGWQTPTPAPVNSVAGRTGAVTLTRSDVGLSNVDNTSDVGKPVSTAQATADAVNATALTAETTRAAAAEASGLARANHTGTQLAATISDLSTAVVAAAPVSSVAGRTGVVTLIKTDVGLGSVDNTSDATKPVSTAQASALAGKQPVTYTITQIAHGFSVGQWVAPRANKYVLAKADGLGVYDGVGMVSGFTTDSFTLQTAGPVTGLISLVPDAQYYLSATTAGGSVGYPPNTAGNVSIPLYVATSETTAVIQITRATSVAVSNTYLSGINVGGDQGGAGSYSTAQNISDAAIVTKNFATNRVRMPIPSYNNANGIANTRQLALYYKSLGYFVSYGVTGNREPAGQTAANYNTYMAQVNTEYEWAYSNNIDRFYIGNEEGNQALVNNYGTVTISQVLTAVKAKATELKTLHAMPRPEIVYSDAQGTIVQWGAASVDTSDLNKFAFNVYDPNFPGFIDYARTINSGSLASKLFISEWAANQPYKYMATSGGKTDETYAADIASRLKVLKDRNLEGYFFALRYSGNGDATTDWNILKLDGTFKPGAREAFGGTGSGYQFQGVLDANVMHQTGAEYVHGTKYMYDGIGIPFINDTNGQKILSLPSVSNATDYLQVTNAPNNGGIGISVQGGSAYTAINISAKGSAPIQALSRFNATAGLGVSGTNSAGDVLRSDGAGNASWSPIVESQVTNLVTDLAATEKSTNKGVANGYAPLDGTAKIASTYLPSYVDDVLEAANFAALPGTGETGKIYVTLDTTMSTAGAVRHTSSLSLVLEVLTSYQRERRISTLPILGLLRLLLFRVSQDVLAPSYSAKPISLT